MSAVDVDRDALILDMATRRPDAVLHTVTGQPRPLRPFAARIHRVAAFITEHELPDAEIAFIEGSVLIEVHEGPVQGGVRRYAAALGMHVTEVPYAMPDGTPGQLWSASGWDGTGTWWMVTGKAPVPTVAR